MKKFIFKCLLAVVPILLLWYIYADLTSYYYMDFEYPSWMQELEYIQTPNGDYNQMVVLGDSTAMAGYRPVIVDGYNTYNLALGGASMIDMYYSLQTYLENHDAPKVVLMANAPVSYMMPTHMLDATVYFHYFKPWQLKEIRSNAKLVNDENYWNAPGIDLTLLRYYIYDPVYYLPAMYNSGFVGRYEYNQNEYSQVVEEKGHKHYGIAPGYYGKHFITTQENFTTNDLLELYLRKTIDLCESKGITFVLEQTPINNSSLDSVPETFNTQFREYFEQIASDYPNAVVNTFYMGCADEMYGDNGHLNEDGAVEYTDYIINTYSYLLEQ